MAIFTPYKIHKDDSGHYSSGSESILPFSAFCLNFLMNVDDTVEVEVPPSIGLQSGLSNTKMVAQFSFTPGKTVYVWDTGQILAIPVNDVPFANAMAINPRNRITTQGTVLKFITPDADVYAQVCFYPVPGSS